MAQAIDKQQVYDLVDQLQPDQLPAAASLLKSMLQADFDDEPVTEEDMQRCRDARAALNQPERWSSMEEVLADFGLTMDDFPLKKK